MGSSLTIDRTFDPFEIMAVLSNPDIWNAISFDGQLPDIDGLPFGDDHIWLITKINGIPVGVNYFNRLNPKMVEFHPSVLPVYRPVFAYDSVKMGIDWIIDNTDIEKLTVQIPECFDRVMRFAKRMGFTEEGVFKSAYPKENKMIDIHLLGLTRSEWADL